MSGKVLLRVLIALTSIIGGGAFAAGTAPPPERMLLTGIPPLGPTWLSGADGTQIPAGCGPEAARLLLLYHDRRHGYRLVGEDPHGAIREIHRLMGTATVTWDGVRQGLTWPWSFTPGLQAYIETRYPSGAAMGTLSGSLSAVFTRSVDLVRQSVPHVILFDWRGSGGIFPNHYAVVVGYDLSAGRMHLVLNPGWGYDFQILDMSDPAVAPVTLFWIGELYNPPDAVPGGPVAPPSAAGMWVTDEDGQTQLRPVLRLHNDPRSTVRWPISSHVQFIVPGLDDLAIVTWDAR